LDITVKFLTRDGGFTISLNNSTRIISVENFKPEQWKEIPPNQ